MTVSNNTNAEIKPNIWTTFGETKLQFTFGQ